MKQHSKRNYSKIVTKQDKIFLKTIKELPISPFEKTGLILFWRGFKKAIDLCVKISPLSRDDPKSKENAAALEKIRNLFRTFGFFFTEGMRQYPIFYLARTKSEAKELKRLFERVTDEKNCYKRLGELSGFPPTAIEAYGKYIDEGSPIDGDSVVTIEHKNLPEEIKKRDWFNFTQFRLSRNNWREELETSKRWAEVTKLLDPKLYEIIVTTILLN